MAFKYGALPPAEERFYRNLVRDIRIFSKHKKKTKNLREILREKMEEIKNEKSISR